MIKTGFCVTMTESEKRIREILSYGVDNISFAAKRPIRENIDDIAERIINLVEEYDVSFSTIGIYGNPLCSDIAYDNLKMLIKNADKFGVKIISTFAGSIPGESVYNAIPLFKVKFSALAEMAEAYGVKIAFENCLQDGSFDLAVTNIAFNPKAWEMMFNAVPSDALGLEWEPAHQMLQLADPLKQLKIWAPKVFHIHGKDAVINHELIDERGIMGLESSQYAKLAYPGSGDTDWNKLIEILRKNRYDGTISIESFYNPSCSMEEQVRAEKKAVDYLRRCNAQQSKTL